MDELMDALMGIDDRTLLELNLDECGYELAALIEKKES